MQLDAAETRRHSVVRCCGEWKSYRRTTRKMKKNRDLVAAEKSAISFLGKRLPQLSSDHVQGKWTFASPAASFAGLSSDHCQRQMMSETAELFWMQVH